MKLRQLIGRVTEAGGFIGYRGIVNFNRRYFLEVAVMMCSVIIFFNRKLAVKVYGKLANQVYPFFDSAYGRVAV